MELAYFILKIYFLKIFIDQKFTLAIIFFFHQADGVLFSCPAPSSPKTLF